MMFKDLILPPSMSLFLKRNLVIVAFLQSLIWRGSHVRLCYHYRLLLLLLLLVIVACYCCLFLVLVLLLLLLLVFGIVIVAACPQGLIWRGRHVRLFYYCCYCYCYCCCYCCLSTRFNLTWHPCQTLLPSQTNNTVANKKGSILLLHSL